MLVEQEGGAVQADGRLTRPRAALHADQVLQRRADHHVLLGLDGGHDVAHLSRARPLQLGEEGVGQPAATGRVGIVEMLVEDVDEHLTVDAEAPPAGQAHGVGVGGAVEGARDAGAPIDDDGLAGGALDMAAPDVEVVADLLVETAEAQRRRRVGERGQASLEVPLDDHRVGRLLHPGRGLADRERARRVLAHGRQAGVRVVEVPLLRGEVGMCVHGGR